MKNKFTLFACSFCIAAMLVTGCASTRDPEPRDLESSAKSKILDHKGTELGISTLPVWVDTYIQSGITGLEKLSDYHDDYCFVAEEHVSNLNAGLVWAKNFDIPQDIARNVSSRVSALFTGASSGSPDETYGTYFESVVKTICDTSFSGAREVANWWVQVRRYDPDVKKQYNDSYSIYVLYTIPRELLDRQVLDVIEAQELQSKVNEEQTVAISQVKAIMQSQGL
ncbi:MAG: hypothetical protein MJ183_00470 [Treponemataceae bacterium]|nr:hypothetical protein [Treponemataceae bacterium]